MPQFTYSATDTAGNVVEGSVAANDMMVAADQVRRMGYTPVRVEVTNEQGMAVPARSLGVAYGEQSQPQYLNAEYQTAEPLNARMPEHRAAPLDLTQAFAEPEQGLDAYNSLLAPPLEMEAVNGQMAVTSERYLEPWERSVGAAVPTTGQEIATEANALETAPALDVTSATTNANAMHVGLNTQATGNTQGRVGVRIPYAPGVEIEKSLKQRFVETMVYPVFSGVVIKELSPFLRQFATLIDAGLPLYQALVALEKNTPNQKLKEVAREGQRQVQAGGRFSDVMAAYPWIFQPMQVAMIRAAEQGGLLDQVLRQVADYIEHEIEIRRLISRETLYPKITLFMALMILGRTGFTSGMPAVSSLVLGSMGKAAYTFSNYLADTVGFGLLIAIPVVAIAIACRLFLFNIAGVRESYDSLKMSIPVLGKLTQMFATAKFARTYAALYRGGFTASSALSIAGDASGNAVIRRAALNAIPAAERGGLVSDSLAQSRALPSMALDMFRTGETTGALDQMMDRIADFYEAEGKQKSHQAALILGVVVFLLVALLVASSIIQQWTAIGTASTTIPDDK